MSRFTCNPAMRSGINYERDQLLATYKNRVENIFGRPLTDAQDDLDLL